MRTSNEFIAAQCEQSGELVECIRSGQASAEQVESHYAAGDVAMQPRQINSAPGYCKNCKDYTIAEPLYAQPVQPATNNVELNTIGTKMSNVFFNMAQREGNVLSAENCEQMKRLYTAWDAAHIKAKDAP